MPLNGSETNTPITPYISNSPPPPNDLDEEAENEENAIQNKPLNLSNLSGELENFSIQPLVKNHYLSQIKSDNEMSKEEEESEKNEEENDEDEWADFVDSKTADLSEPSSTNQHIKQEEPTFNSGASQLNSPTLKPNIDLSSPIKLVEPFKFEQLDSNQLINRIFGSLFVDVQNRFPVSTSNVDVNFLDMKNDAIWHQLKEYTCENDASASLKFKWTMSELETNFLNSIQVERVSVLNNAQHI